MNILFASSTYLRKFCLGLDFPFLHLICRERLVIRCLAWLHVIVGPECVDTIWEWTMHKTNIMTRGTNTSDIDTICKQIVTIKASSNVAHSPKRTKKFLYILPLRFPCLCKHNTETRWLLASYTITRKARRCDNSFAVSTTFCTMEETRVAETLDKLPLTNHASVWLSEMKILYVSIYRRWIHMIFDRNDVK